MKLTVSTIVDQRTGQDQYQSIQYSKVIDGGETIYKMLCWATNVHKKHSIHKLPDDWLADIWDIRIGKVED
jgi:hypothetical protein